MFKTLLHKVFSVALALLVLFSTTSFTVEKHFCGGHLIDYAVFSEVKKCTSKTSGTEQCAVTKKRCCKDVYETIEGQDQLNLSKIEGFNPQQLLIATSFVYSYLYALNELPKLVIPHKDYSPPDLIEDIQLLEEVFLI